jgi:hypothetical protein
MTSDQKIDRILGFEPGRERELPQIFIVGEKHGLSGLVVTSIEYGVTNYGDHGIGWYYVKSFDTTPSRSDWRAITGISAGLFMIRYPASDNNCIIRN